MSETQTTLRDTLSAEFDKLEQAQTPEVTPNDAPETPEQKADRIRDEKGRFAANNESTQKRAPTVDTQRSPANTSTKTEAEGLETKARPQRPSSWKKDYWEHWDKLDPKLAEYINQREQEYAKGVSTYKNEWENAKPLVEAMAQFQPLLQQHNIQPSQWISNLGNAHKQLVLGSPQEKLQMFAKLAQDYQVPLQHLFVQGQDGKVYLNNQLLTTQQPAQSQQQPQDIRKVVQQMLIEQSMQQEVERASGDAERFPHFEQVRETMAGLLQSGLADDLKSAYESAIRLPKHADLFETQQQQLRQQEEAKRQEAAKARVQTARANAVSPKTATPSSQVTTSGNKGLRAALEEAFDSHVSGRV